MNTPSSSAAPIRVLLCDDHDVVREGLAALLQREADIEVVGGARDGDEAVKMYDELRPDVLLLDLKMPNLSGAGAVAAIREAHKGARAIVLTTYDGDAAQTRARYAAIDKAIPRATVVKRDLEGYSQEGGELTAYFQKGAPLKMVAHHFGEHGRSIDELYFWNGRLFFVLETTEQYQKGIGQGGGPDKLRSRQQNRFYFRNGKLLRWMDEDGKSTESGADFKSREKEQLQFARQMLAGARGTAKTIVAP